MAHTGTQAIRHAPGASEAGLTRRNGWLALALLGVTIAAFAGGRAIAQGLIDLYPKSAEPVFYAAALFSLAVALLPPATGSMPQERAFRWLSAGVGLILALSAAPVLIGYPVANPDFAPLARRLFLVGPLVVLVFGCLAFWRPVLLIACAMFPLVERATVGRVSGLPIGSLDIYPVYEVGLFLGTSAAILTAVRRFRPEWTRDTRYLAYVWVFALGIHFGNYFHSGVEKLLLDGPPLAWVFENETNNLGLLAAWFNGRWLLSHDPALSVRIAGWLAGLNTPTNLFVLLIQIAAPLAILRLSWIRIQTILYDIMHIGIFLIVGILFWKWILLNLAFLWSAGKVPRERFDRSVMIVGVLATLFGICVAQTARLAWYNTPALSSRLIYANTQDGESVPVPISFFLNQSYSVSHARFAVDDAEMFPTSEMGNTRLYAVKQAASACDFSGLASAPGYRQPSVFAKDMEATRSFIRAHHAFYLNLSDDGRFNYQLFPFHHFANPADYAAFFALDKRRITSYSLVARSHCLSAAGASLKSDVRYETRYDIPVR